MALCPGHAFLTCVKYSMGVGGKESRFSSPFPRHAFALLAAFNPPLCLDHAGTSECALNHRLGLSYALPMPEPWGWFDPPSNLTARIGIGVLRPNLTLGLLLSAE
jgi:hypothetical protein